MQCRYQVWAVPGLSGDASFAMRDVTVRSVAIEAPTKELVPVTLLETTQEQATLEELPEEGMRRIGRALSVLQFSLLSQFHPVAARVLADGLAVGDEVVQIAFPGSPPGIALSEVKLGYQRLPVQDPTILNREVSAVAERAISWFLMGLFSNNSAHQVLCHWIGLEALAPSITGPWKCPHCDAATQRCPHCGSDTVGPKTVQSIRSYLEGALGVSRREYADLYKLRCRMTHGDLGMDPDGVAVAARKAQRIQQLLLEGIKRELNWPASDAPLIHTEGITISGVAGVRAVSTMTIANYYDRPSILPA